MEFYEAAEIVLQGLVNLAKRYSDLLRRKPGGVGPESGVAEISRICSRVPAHRPHLP